MLLVSHPRAQETKLPPPPATRKDNVKEVIHGVEIVDPYRWLEDQSSAETRAWIDAQNKHSDSLLGTWAGHAALKRRLTELIKIDMISVPRERGGRYFYKQRLASQEQGILYMRKGERSAEVLVDPNPLSPDQNVSVSLEGVSDDGTLVAYGLRNGGEDETTIHLINVDTRQEPPDRLPRGRYFTISCLPDKSGVYYSRHDADGPHAYFHAMGTDPAKDTIIFGKGYGQDKILLTGLPDGGRYLMITVLHGSAADQTEIYVQDLSTHGPLQPIVNDIPARFFGEIGGDVLFLRTNWKAPKGRILAVDLKNPGRDNWREVLPEGESVIDSFSLAGGQLVVRYTVNAHSELRVFDAAGHFLRELVLPAVGTVSGIESRWTGKEMFFAFASFHIPQRIYLYLAESGAQSVWAQVKVPIQTENLEVQQIWYTSRDQTRIPMFLLYRRGLKLDGKNPALLTGYGGFNLSETPAFSAAAALWAEQGGVFALPNLRGGGEFGETWHQAGMLDKKQNVFDDFIAAAEWLVENHYTQPSRLAIMGSSNGGLLVGAALTQRPDLFRAVVCRYPLLDMLRYDKFLVARYWVSEYGSADNPAQFKVLEAYSPYQHVKAGTKYPAVLFVTGDGDTRVAPLHARKMTALVQASTDWELPVLLHYDTEAGHSQGVSVTKSIDEVSIWVGFLFWQLEIPFKAPGS
jgi:prolyl oligopeptidase